VATSTTTQCIDLIDNSTIVHNTAALTGSPTGPPPCTTVTSYPVNSHSSAPTGPPTGPPTSTTVTSHTIHVHPSVPRITDRVAAMHRRTADPQSILGRWLAQIRDPLRCPSTLSGGMNLKGSPSHAIDEFIDSLRHNLLPRVLRLQNINISNIQIRRLLDILPSTNIYAVNIGEADLDKLSRQHLCSVIPNTHLTQIFLKDLRDPALRTHILHLLEHNRSKVSTFQLSINETLPDHVQTMWKRIKSTDPVQAPTRKRSTHISTNDQSQDERSQPPSKKRLFTTGPTDKMS
jgi:hypothetical protein